MPRKILIATLLAATSLITVFTAAPALAIDPPQAPVPGRFDPSFGSHHDGFSGAIQITVDGPDNLEAMVIQPDRKIVVAGGCGQPAKFCVARLLTDGRIDLSFTGDNIEGGKFTLNVGAPGFDSVVTSLAVQADGKLLIVGNCHTANGKLAACVARLLTDGRLDTGFVGPNGVARGSFVLPISGIEDSLSTVLAQPDGKIVVLGICLAAPDVKAACGARLLANGALDPSFHGPAGTGAGTFAMSLSGESDATLSARLQSDQKIVIATACVNDPQAPGARRACMTRLDGNGRFDATFNAGGTPGQIRFISGGSAAFSPASLLVQPDGKLVLLGSCLPVATQPERLCLARYLPEGVADRSFVGPTRLGQGSFALAVTGVAGRANAHGIAQQRDGKLLIGGLCGVTADDSELDVCVARLHGDGSFDTSFDGPAGQPPGNGSFLQGLSERDPWPLRLQIQADGQIVHGYRCHTGPTAPARMCVARVHGGPIAAPQCSLDVDGDGVAGTVTDALIAVRAVMGMSGWSVRGGITFTESATRSTWEDIHRYLTRECGLSLPENPET